MWGRHYWGGGRRPSWAPGGDGAGAGAGGVVVMFAWLSSQERHVRAYVELYAAHGWACLVCHSDFLTLFFPEKAAMLADKVLQLIERRCEGQLSLDEYQLVRDCLCGQIYDSSPVDFVSDLGTRFLLHPSVLKMSEPPRVLSWMTKGIASGLDILFIDKFEEQRKDYWETLYSSVHFGPILILCSEDDQLATYSVVQNFGQHLLELGGDVNLIKWHSSPHVGHYKFHPEEYRAAVTELLKKASVLYMSRRQLNGYDVGTSEHSDTPPSTSNLPRTAASSVGSRLRRAPIDPTDQFFLPSSMEYHESSEGPQPELFNMPSLESLSLHGVLGQVLYDVCVPKNVEGWDLKPSASMNGRHIHTAASRHGSFNPMKCVRRSRL
ncbi:hypothetical protein SORBI_3005G187200 [Sorghum bicolor]|uniref:Uncharacterized protein n=1 Tax=Sorghum bicolor TaxID=4558 RepID=A0A1Z5RJD0_SORBI|nr:hypothetical protein SORBI_3005G187200 [Sorghum bicolor]